MKNKLLLAAAIFAVLTLISSAVAQFAPNDVGSSGAGFSADGFSGGSGGGGGCAGVIDMSAGCALPMFGS